MLVTSRFLTVWHADLTDDLLRGLGGLFDAEYRGEFGPWDPEAPYGYSPAELHVIAIAPHGGIAGHAGAQRRRIGVGSQEATIAGTGGVLVDPSFRGTGLGQRMMASLQEAGRGIAPADFGYLGCREEVVPFYLSCGYTRIHATERHLSRTDPGAVVEGADGPVLVCAGTRGVETWPAGAIDLRGTPW